MVKLNLLDPTFSPKLHPVSYKLTEVEEYSARFLHYGVHSGVHYSIKYTP